MEFLDNQLLSSLELPDLANKSGEHPDKFESQMNINNFSSRFVPSISENIHIRKNI